MFCRGVSALCLLTAARRARFFDTEMAEGELDVDSLISRLLEGEFPITFACRLFFQTLCLFRSVYLYVKKETVELYVC